MRICYKQEIIETARLYCEGCSLVDFDSSPRENIRAFFQLLRCKVEDHGEPLDKFLRRQREAAQRIIWTWA